HATRTARLHRLPANQRRMTARGEGTALAAETSEPRERRCRSAVLLSPSWCDPVAAPRVAVRLRGEGKGMKRSLMRVGIPALLACLLARSEERRVGKECRSRGGA